MTIQPTTRLHNGRVLLLHGKAEDRLKQIKDNYVDLTVTSPPYDDLRTYNGFSFDFETIAKELFRVTKIGGTIVWIVADRTLNGSETGTSFRQALYFKEIGFNLHDTMIYAIENYMPKNSNRYDNGFEFMFIFTKGRINTFNPIKIPTKHGGKTIARTADYDRQTDGTMKARYHNNPTQLERTKSNIWFYTVGTYATGTDQLYRQHPAPYPEKLARDHILSWSNPDDIVLDPFMGSGTTGKMAILNNRRFIGVELSAEYITDIALPRCQQAIESLTND